MFVKAERSKAKLRLGITGPAGSGKTHTSLLIAAGLGGKIAVIDSENASASKEVGKPGIPDFDVLVLSAPFTPEKYIEAIKDAERAGYDVVIIDSMTHPWSGSGGVLEKVNAITQSSSSKNSYTAWNQLTPVQNRFFETILQSRCHVIGTMRSKVDYALVEEITQSGKVIQRPQKLGMAPIQREGADYEFDVVLDLNQSTHVATATKDRTSLFDGTPFVPTKETGEKLKEWLNSGVEAKPNCDNCRMNGIVIPSVIHQDSLNLCQTCLDKFIKLSDDDKQKAVCSIINNNK